MTISTIALGLLGIYGTVGSGPGRVGFCGQSPRDVGMCRVYEVEENWECPMWTCEIGLLVLNE